MIKELGAVTTETKGPTFVQSLESVSPAIKRP